MALALLLVGMASAHAQARDTVAEKVLAFQQLKARATEGEAVAQRQLAQVYERCRLVNQNPQQFERDIALRLKTMDNAEAAANLKRVAHERTALCSQVDGGSIVTTDRIDGWYLQAAENGDLPAGLKLQMKIPEKPAKAEVQLLLEQVVADKDPATVMALGHLVAGPGLESGTPAHDGLLSGDVAGFAWMIAACRLGYACEAQGELMDEACPSMNGCGNEDYESFIRTQRVAGKQVGELDQKVKQVMALLKLQ